MLLIFTHVGNSKRYEEQIEQTLMIIILIFQATLFVEQIFTKFDTDKNGTIDFRVREAPLIIIFLDNDAIMKS